MRYHCLPRSDAAGGAIISAFHSVARHCLCLVCSTACTAKASNSPARQKVLLSAPDWETSRTLAEVHALPSLWARPRVAELLQVKTPTLPCVSTACAAKTPPWPCVSTAFVAKTPPSHRVSHRLRAAAPRPDLLGARCPAVTLIRVNRQGQAVHQPARRVRGALTSAPKRRCNPV